MVLPAPQAPFLMARKIVWKGGNSGLYNNRIEHHVNHESIKQEKFQTEELVLEDEGFLRINRTKATMMHAAVHHSHHTITSHLKKLRMKDCEFYCYHRNDLDHL
mmetsp:Transcript_12994/g.20142  ORF Transcript_12994/g.20142 Transcript_12994/m.20142 type:complete len:104 (+) Transcript_12994:620-931(+)